MPMLVFKGKALRGAASAFICAALLGGTRAASPVMAPQFTHAHTED
jgi:hypothetical protein